MKPKSLYLNAKAIIWPWLAYMFQVRSTAIDEKRGLLLSCVGPAREREQDREKKRGKEREGERECVCDRRCEALNPKSKRVSGQEAQRHRVLTAQLAQVRPLNLNPYTLNATPYTLDPKPHSLNPKPYILDLKPQPQNPYPT